MARTPLEEIIDKAMAHAYEEARANRSLPYDAAKPFAASVLALDRAAGVGEAERIAIDQNDAMRQELAHIGNLVSDLARAMRVDQANPDGTWPDLAGCVQKLTDAALAASPPAPADASDFSPHRWTEIISNGLGANNAGCWRCGALSEVLARVLSLSGHDAKVIQGKANGEDHVWVQIGDTVYDPTVGQFQEPVFYQMDQVAPADASGEVERLREAAAKCDPVLRDKPSVKVMAGLLKLGAEHQRPRSKQYARGEHNAEADAEFIVAAINFARAALTQQGNCHEQV